MTRLALLVATALLSATDVPRDDPSAADLARMQGDWMVASMKSNGIVVPADDAQALFRSIDGEKFTITRYTKIVNQGTFKVDATKSPKTIDTLPTTLAPAAGQPILGIYEFDGEKLRVCNGKPGQPRPKNFDAKQFTGHTLIVWERETK